MAVKKLEPTRGFDVTVETTIGSVDFNELGDFNTPVHAAFDIIATHMWGNEGNPGTFHFPAESGGTMNLAITFDKSEEKT